MTKIKTLVALALTLACGASAGRDYDSDEGDALAPIAPTIAAHEQGGQSDAQPEQREHELTSREHEADPAQPEPEPAAEPDDSEVEPVEQPETEPPEPADPEPHWTGRAWLPADPAVSYTVLQCVSPLDCDECFYALLEAGEYSSAENEDGIVCHYRPCEVDDECGGDLICAPVVTGGTLACREVLAQEHEPCEVHDECEPGLVCLPIRRYSPDHTCQPPPPI